MPIPILKGLRRAGAAPQTENPRNLAQRSKTPSPRSNVRLTTSAAASSSSIPALNANSARIARSSPATRSPRITTTRIVGIQSPRPPPRVSSVITSPRPSHRSAPSRDIEAKIKLAHVKKTDTFTDAQFQQNTLAVSSAGASNSNRSSVISNGSSIPPPSSSSSNRNSNSSIGSSFSVNSWNSNNASNNADLAEENHPDKLFISRGADTFPRSSALRRSFNVPGSLTTSVTVDTRDVGRTSIQRLSKSKENREVTKTSVSESAIAVKTRSTEELSATNLSDSHLSRLKPDKSAFGSLRFSANRNFAKTNSVTKRGATKSTCNYSGHSYLPATNRSADPNSNKTRLVHPDGFKSPSRTPKLKYRSVNSKSCTGAKAANESTDEEDDGYSSVANNDQPDDDRALNKVQQQLPSVVIDDNDYDEVEESLEDIQPMKPLEGLSRYSFSSSVSIQNRVSSEAELSATISKSETGPESGQSFAVNLPNRRTLSKTLKHPSKQHLRGGSPSDLKFESLSPKFLRPKTPPPLCTSKLMGSLPNSETMNLRSKTKDEVKHLSEESMSAFDDSILDISYKDFIKDVKPSTNKEIYSWEVRTSISGPVPSVKRKLGLSIESSNGSASTSPSLPMLNSNNVATRDTHSAPPSRPSSLTSPGKLNFPRASYSSATLSSQFYRTGSLRSPKENCSVNDRKLTHPFVRSGQALQLSSEGGTSCSTLGGQFVRNSPKYSTVIPRTLKENQTMSYPFVHSLHDQQQNIRDNSSIDETERLLRELKSTKETIMSLTEQLSSSNKLVAAYEHSLSNMTQRLQQLTKVSEQKDTEISELRRLLERTCLDSSSGSDSRTSTLRSAMNRCSSIESMTSLTSNASFSSAVSTSSTISFSSSSSRSDKSIKKKNWLRSSFSKAFKRREKRKRSDILASNSVNRRSPLDLDSLLTQSDNEGIRGYCSLPSSPLPQRCSSSQKLHETFSDIENSTSNTEVKIDFLKEEVSRLKKALQNKDSTLTESRLESLTSAHHIDALKESIHRLSAELSLVKSQSVCDSSTVDVYNYPKSRVTYTKSISLTSDGKTVAVYVRRSDVDKVPCFDDELDQSYPNHEYIGNVIIQGKTSWEELDNLINDSFEEHLSYLDPKGKLFLDGDAILNYQLGEVKRTPMLDVPELLPYGYLVGEVESINVNLQTSSLNSVDLMSFETLISKTHLQRFISFLKDQRRVILTGPQGVGKSFLAHRLADFIVQRLGIEPSLGNIAKFNVDEKTAHDLHVYLSQLSDLCESKSTDLPLVIVLESLEKIDKLSELFAGSLRIPHDQCPFIIGTLRVTARRMSVLQIHPSFRLIPLDPTQDPVSNILPRLCRRYVRTARAVNLDHLFEWLCRCLSLLNHILDSSGVDTFGPGTLLPLPSSLNGAQAWFFELWKLTLLPRLQTAAENVSLVSRDLNSWKDLDKCLREELPWEPNAEGVSLPSLSSAE